MWKDYTEEFSRLKENMEDINSKVPIRRGCPNSSCFCTGACREIIGWRDRLPEESRMIVPRYGHTNYPLSQDIPKQSLWQKLTALWKGVDRDWETT